MWPPQWSVPQPNTWPLAHQEPPTPVLPTEESTAPCWCQWCPALPLFSCNELITSALDWKSLEGRDPNWFIFAPLHQTQDLKHNKPLANICWTKGNNYVLPFMGHLTCVKHLISPSPHQHTTQFCKWGNKLRKWNSLPKVYNEEIQVCLWTPVFKHSTAGPKRLDNGLGFYKNNLS